MKTCVEMIFGMGDNKKEFMAEEDLLLGVLQSSYEDRTGEWTEERNNFE